jgi:hypothetical protein
VRAYARFLFKLQDVDWATSRPDVFAILAEGLCAPLPSPWQVKCFRSSIVYYNAVTRTSSDEHPSDAAIRSRCLSILLPPSGSSSSASSRSKLRASAIAALLLLLAAAAYIACSFIIRAVRAIDFECSWGMRLQQALALAGPCNACIAVGSSYYTGGADVISQAPTAINFTKAAQWFSRALKRGCRHALRPLALSLYNGASSHSASSSLHFRQESDRSTCDVMTECADAGHVECVALLADMLYKGSMGCPRDFAAGGQRAVAAGQAGSVIGACTLASMIADGRAFTRRAEEALKWAHVCSLHGGGESASAAVLTLRQEVSTEEHEAARKFALQWRKHRAIDLAD